MCREPCHRAVHLSCCPGCPVCRSCGIKHVTGARSCWQCAQPGALSAHLLADELVRGAVTFHKENGGEHCKNTLGDLLQRKIRCLQELAAGTKSRNNDDDILVVKEDCEVDSVGKTSGNDLRHKISSKAGRSKDLGGRDGDRDRARDRRRDRELERGGYSDKKNNRSSRTTSPPPQPRERKEASQDTNVGHPSVVVGSFAALQRRIRQEQETVERLVTERIEEYIASMVADQLRARKAEIHAEVLGNLAAARQNMEAEVLLEIALMKKFRAAEQAQRMAELEARMAEGERRMEEEKKKLAEERLVILENQARILF